MDWIESFHTTVLPGNCGLSTICHLLFRLSMFTSRHLGIGISIKESSHHLPLRGMQRDKESRIRRYTRTPVTIPYHTNLSHPSRSHFMYSTYLSCHITSPSSHSLTLTPPPSPPLLLPSPKPAPQRLPHTTYHIPPHSAYTSPHPLQLPTVHVPSTQYPSPATRQRHPSSNSP